MGTTASAGVARGGGAEGTWYGSGHCESVDFDMVEGDEFVIWGLGGDGVVGVDVFYKPMGAGMGWITALESGYAIVFAEDPEYGVLVHHVTTGISQRNCD